MFVLLAFLSITSCGINLFCGCGLQLTQQNIKKKTPDFNFG